MARRDDKRRDRHRARRPRRPWLVGGAVAVVIVVGAVVAAALAGGGDTSSSRSRAGAGNGAATSGAQDDVAVGAISADYRGGRQTVKTCVDATGAACTARTLPWEPLTVRCTAAGCTAAVFNTTVTLGSGATPYRADFVYESPECGTVPMVGSLRSVGHVTTHGLQRPQRIVGTLRIDAPAHQIPGFDCLGGVQEYAYDASAS